jgi:hypothetical protein
MRFVGEVVSLQNSKFLSVSLQDEGILTTGIATIVILSRSIFVNIFLNSNSGNGGIINLSKYPSKAKVIIDISNLFLHNIHSAFGCFTIINRGDELTL